MLIIAAKKGHTDCVRLLIEAGADKEAKEIVWASFAATFDSAFSFSLSLYLCATCFIFFSHTFFLLYFLSLCRSRFLRIAVFP